MLVLIVNYDLGLNCNVEYVATISSAAPGYFTNNFYEADCTNNQAVKSVIVKN